MNRPLFRLCLVLVTITGWFSLSAEEAPKLIIEPGGHSALVKELIFTPDGERLISLGFDKTIRIWEVSSGNLLETIRLEIGDADAGKHYSGALSPDGRFLVVGGWATSDTELVGRIRVINLETGKIAAVLRGHTNTISDLVFTSDGSSLVSASSDESVRIWAVSAFSTSTGEAAVDVTQSEKLTGHGGDVAAAAVDSSGLMLVTGGADQTIKLWKRSTPDAGFSLIRTLTGHPNAISSLVLTGDGGLIISGDRGGDLYFWNPETGARMENRDLNFENQIATMTLSPDDSHLLFSSESSVGGKTAILEVNSGEESVVFEEHDNSVFASAWNPVKPLVATSGGNHYDTYLWRPEAAGGSEPGTVLQHFVGKGLPVYNVGYSQVNPLEVVFGTIPDENGSLSASPLQMILDFKTLKSKPLETQEQADSFQTLNWQVNDDVLLYNDKGGVTVEGRGSFQNTQNSNDWFRTATFSADGKSVIAGGSYYLLRYTDSSGSFREVNNYIGHEADINAVSISPDGNYFVSGSMDQTMRLWNLKTGDLLVSCFFTQDGEGIVWTPDGYFDATPNGGDLIGWHFNQGFDKVAEFVSGDQLYDHFYRPDIVARTIMEGKASVDIVRGLGIVFDLEKAMKGTPGIAILEPKDKTKATKRRVAVSVEAIDNGGGIGEVRVFHEGKRLQPDGPGSFRNGRYEVPFTVSLLSGQNEIRAVAVNPDGGESTPEIVHVEFEGTKATAKLYLLAVGLNKYKNPKFNLNYCRPDVDAFADSFEKGSGKLFSEIIIEKLYDENATSEGISEKLKQIAGVANADDVFVFAFAGHGVMSEGASPGEGAFHIIPYDVTQMYGNDDMLAEKALSGAKLQEMAAAIPARKQLMVLDTCQSGGVIESFAVRGAAEEKALAQLARSTGMYVLASTRSEQFATETEELGHGLFTYALLEALGGKGDQNKDGKITVKEVEAFLNERVPELSEEHTGAAQYPNSFARGQDFPIGVIE